MPHRLLYALKNHIDHPIAWLLGLIASTAWGKALLSVANDVGGIDHVPLLANPMPDIIEMNILPEWGLQLMIVGGFALWAVMTIGIAARLWAMAYKTVKEADAMTPCRFPGKCPYEIYRKEEYGCQE